MAKHITSSPSYIKYSKGSERTFTEPYKCDAEYILSEVKGIRGPYHKKLRRVGLVTTKDLLKRCRSPVARESYANEIGIDTYLLMKWTKMADLMRIEGIGQQFAELLMLVGIESTKTLAKSDPESIIEPLQNPGSMPVSNLRIDDEFDVVDGTDNLRNAAKLMVKKNLPDLVVCEGKKPEGVLTFRSIVRSIADGLDVDKSTIEEVIVDKTPTLSPDSSIEKAAQMLIDLELPVLPVEENRELVGVVSRNDIEEAFLKISQRRPSIEEVERWVEEAKKHKPINVH
jgi:CBS domain-containing protein